VAQTLRVDGELANRLLAAAPRAVLFVLVILIAFRAAFLVGALAGRSGGPLEPVAPLPASASRQVVDIPSILRANLFGQSASSGSAENAPVTTMALHLGGVFPYNDEKMGFAILGNSAADQKFYRVGDAVPGGALLYAVHGDRVLLDRSGSIEALLMPPRTSLSLAPPPPPMANPAASVASVRELMRENPSLINRVMRRTAVIEGGQLKGVRVFPGSNPQAFARLGLRAGDTVTAVNGMALDDQARAETVFGTLETAAEARVTITRNGASQELVLNLAEIAAEASRLAEAPPPDPASVDGNQPPGPESAR
jgi:general secretion pathway protein C